MPLFDLATLRTASIHIAEDAAPSVSFAAAELQRYFQEMTGERVEVARAAALPDARLVLGAAPAPAALPVQRNPQAFAILPEAARITLAAGSPRALLDATYAMLAQCGCRWSLPGTGEEVVPHLPGPALALECLERVPSFAERGYAADIMTWHYTQAAYLQGRLAADRAFIDWMGKSGANVFCFIRHPFDSQLTIPDLVPEFQRRGIALEYGGHVIPLLLPRSLFREHPDYFPQSRDGQRADHGNLCPSNPAALATAGANAVGAVRQHPEMSTLHIWGADLWHGGWCNCVGCRGMSVQDQSLRVCNAVARALREAGCERPVCYLAYHDTIEPQLTVAPDDNVLLEFAPRERCYSHPLNDPDCAANRRYAAALERYIALFAARVRVFEYYGDAILFCGCAVPLTAVIDADLAYYAQLGVPGITMLQFGSYSAWAYALNFLTFAACAAGPCAASAALDAYCTRFGAYAPRARDLLADVEAIMRPVVSYGDIRRPPRTAAAALPVLAQVTAALPRLTEAAARLAELGDDALGAQAALLRYTQAVLNGVRQELLATAGEPHDGSAGYDEALRLIDAVELRFKGLWGSVDLPIIHRIFDGAAALG